MKPLFFFGLDRDELASLGHMMVTYAHIDDKLNHVLNMLFIRMVLQPGAMRRVGDATRFHNIAPRIAALKKLVKVCDDQVQFLAYEFRLAMKHVVPARNLIAHGVLLDAGLTSAEFRSWSKNKYLSVADVLGSEVWFDYALHTLAQASWKLEERTVDIKLPDRPS